MKYFVERIENNTAICETDGGEILNMELSRLPADIREGDVIIQTENGFAVDCNETQTRRHKMAELQKNIFKKR